MNHKAYAIAPIVAVAALAFAAVMFAIPHQAFAGGHHHHHNHNNGNRIDVSQTINQENVCSFADCVNDAQNQADIHR
ncbi:MAG: hypothetical protein WCF23_18500 [Candidatus Nitrosopolaris sp.]